MVPYCAQIDTPATSITICVEEGRFFYRVRAMTDDDRSSVPCNIVSSIHDITPPDLESIVLFDPGTGDSTWTETRKIKVRYLAHEKYPAFIKLWEQSGDTSVVSVTDTAGIVDFTLSAAEERKTVFACMVDMADSTGDTVQADIYYGSPHNYPNPFNPPDQHTNMVFRLPQAGEVNIVIFDLFGDKVYESGPISATKGLNDGQTNPQLRWNGRNGKGELVASGGYLCKIKRDDETIKDKIIKIGVLRKK
jgi:flagellar hook assembly protein FlgD